MLKWFQAASEDNWNPTQIFDTFLTPVDKISFRILFIYFLERGEGQEKQREGNIDVLEIRRLVASRMSPTGVWLSTQACALTEN